jgi:hypothetical protein
MDNICIKSPDNQHNYQHSESRRETVCIYCDDIGITDMEKSMGGAGKVRTGDAILTEIPGNEKVKTEQAPKCPGTPPIDNNTVNGMLLAFQLHAQILAVQARIEGMKIRNTVMEIEGYSPEYKQEAFMEAGGQISQYAEFLRQAQL